MLFSPEAHEALLGHAVERRDGAAGDRNDRRRGRGCVRRRLVDASGGRGGGRRSGDAVPDRLSRRCGSRGRRSTGSRGRAWSSCGGTMSRISSARSRPRRTSRTRTPSAASGWARPGSGSCSSGRAPSEANLQRLSELIAANERDERCELMWGSPGTILAGRGLGLDISASFDGCRATGRGRPLVAAALRAESPATSVLRTASPGASSRSARPRGLRDAGATSRSSRTGWSTGRRYAGRSDSRHR